MAHTHLGPFDFLSEYLVENFMELIRLGHQAQKVRHHSSLQASTRLKQRGKGFGSAVESAKHHTLSMSGFYSDDATLSCRSSSWMMDGGRGGGNHCDTPTESKHFTHAKDVAQK